MCYRSFNRVGSYIFFKGTSMKKILVGIMLCTSSIGYGSAPATGQAPLKDRIAQLKELWSTASEEGVKGAQQQTFLKIQALWNAKRNDLGARVITPLLKDLKKAGVSRDMIPLLEKKMIALFKRHFTSAGIAGGNQALNVVLYEYLKGAENLQKLNAELGDAVEAWSKALDAHGEIVTYWQRFIVEQLNVDKELVGIRGPLAKLKEGYRQLYKTLEPTVTPGAASVIAEFLKDPIWQRYEVEERVLRGSELDNVRAWAISNGGKLYYSRTSDPYAYMVTSEQLYCYDATTQKSSPVAGLPDRFTLKRDSCLIQSESGEIFKVDLDESRAISLNFSMPDDRQLTGYAYDGTTLLLTGSRQHQQIMVHNTQTNKSYQLPKNIVQAYVSPSGNVIVGLDRSSNNQRAVLDWFYGSDGKLLREQENKQLGSMYYSALSDKGSVFAFKSKHEDEIIVESSPIAKNKKYLSKSLHMSVEGDLYLGRDGEILISNETIYFVNSGIKISRPRNARKPHRGDYDVTSSQRNWIAFQATPGSEEFDAYGTNNVIYIWKLSASAVNQLKKDFNSINKSRASSLTKQSELNLLELYRNREIVDMPKGWMDFAEKLVENDEKTKSAPRTDLATMFQSVGQEMLNRGKVE